MTLLTPEQKIRDILTAYKRYPYGTKELPHITGDEAVQQLLALKSKWELETLCDVRDVLVRGATKTGIYLNDRIGQLTNGDK